MNTIGGLSDRFFNEERVTGNILGEDSVLAQAVAVVNFHAGYADLQVHSDIPVYDPPRPFPEITEDTTINLSEWALMRPLFLLYIERESAIQLEASRSFGIDVFGRSSSEISAEILQSELEYSKKAFSQLIITV